MGPHTFCMEEPIHAWCAQYEHTVHEFKSLYRYFVPTVYQYRCYSCIPVPVLDLAKHTVDCRVCAVGLKSGWEICAVAYSPVYLSLQGRYHSS